VNERAIFLDRDGTLIEERHYLSDPKQVTLLPGVVEGLILLEKAGFLLFVVSNQSGVARGYFTEDDVKAVNEELDRQLRMLKIGIEKYYFCPHHPNGSIEQYAIHCDCRKPKSGFLIQAAKEYSLDLTRSWMVGDKISDAITGESLGVKGILVRSGYGQSEAEKHGPSINCCDSLFQAAELILNNL
jgi:D-glycero-D-manno-heptose 1,7-bisphosphate phosphatase